MSDIKSLNRLAAAPGRLSVAAHLESGIAQITLIGSLDVSDQETLDSLLTRLHQISLSLHVQQVHMDFSRLESMAPSCFKGLVSWLGWVRDLPAAQRYLVRFQASPTIRWQRASLSALSTIAGGVAVLD